MIKVILNTETPEYDALQKDLANEFNALGQMEGIEIAAKKTSPPEGTLAGPDVFQFIINNRVEIVTLIQLGTAVLQIVNALMARHKIREDRRARSKERARTKDESKSYIAMIIMGDHHLNFPSSGEKQRKFLAEITNPSSLPKKRTVEPRRLKPATRSRVEKKQSKKA